MTFVIVGALRRRRVLRLPRRLNGARYVQIHSAECREAEDATEEEAHAESASRAVNADDHHLLVPQHKPAIASAAMALADRVSDRQLPLRPKWTPEGAASGLTPEELTTASEYLTQLQERIQHECDVDADTTVPLSSIERNRLEKRVTKHQLDRLLRDLDRKRQYRVIEGIVFLWDDAFPAHASNMRHWRLLCEYYAIALNKQQRFHEVIEKLFTNGFIHVSTESDVATPNFASHMVLTPWIVEAILLACERVNDADTALHALAIARERGIRINKATYLHALNTLLQDKNPTGHFDMIVHLCEDLVRDAQCSVPLWIMATVLTLGARLGELDRVLPLYSHPPNVPFNSYLEFRFEVCLQTMWTYGHTDAMFHVLENVLNSQRTSPEMKARVTKCLLRKSVEEHAPMATTRALIELMETHEIAMPAKTIRALLPVLIEEDHMETIATFRDFFARYPHVIQWNAHTVSEVLLVGVRLKRMTLVQEAIVHALNENIPIKYVALESVVASYYRDGRVKDLEMAARIIRAMRLNQYLPLGVSVTEIGMASNLSLRRYNEVIQLFEDFRTHNSMRVLERKPMLEWAAKAYSKAKRFDEANAIRQLLAIHHPQPVGDREDMEVVDDDDDASGSSSRSSQR